MVHPLKSLFRTSGVLGGESSLKMIIKRWFLARWWWPYCCFCDGCSCPRPPSCSCPRVSKVIQVPCAHSSHGGLTMGCRLPRSRRHCGQQKEQGLGAIQTCVCIPAVSLRVLISNSGLIAQFEIRLPHISVVQPLFLVSVKV